MASPTRANNPCSGCILLWLLIGVLRYIGGGCICEGYVFVDSGRRKLVGFEYPRVYVIPLIFADVCGLV